MAVITEPPQDQPQPGSVPLPAQSPRELLDEFLVACAALIEALKADTAAVQDLDRNLHKLRDLIATKIPKARR